MSVFETIKARIFGANEQISMSFEGESRAGSSPAVVMYSTRFCPYCMRARALLQQKNVRYRDIAVDGKPELRREMAEKAGRHTVPQIWIGDKHVGGCDELMQLEREGHLDSMLQSEGDV